MNYVTAEGGVTSDAVGVQNFDDTTFVSVAYDPDTTDYSDENRVYDLVKEAIQQLNPGNPHNPLSDLVEQGDVVALKPNLVGVQRIASEGCTRTPVLRPIIDLAVEAGASKVVIAEGPADPDLNDEVFHSMNIDDLTSEMQAKYPAVTVKYQNINKDNWTWVELGQNSTLSSKYTSQDLYSYREIRMDQDSYYYAPDSNGYNPQGYTPGLYAISNTILEADVLINVPKMKVHMITGVTMSLKNLIGITVSDTANTTNQEDIKDIPHWNTSYSHRGEDKERIDTFENDVIWRVNADLHKISSYADKNGNLQHTRQREYLSVLDGIIGMEGPLIYDDTPDPRPTGVIVAGQDPVAVDIVGSRIMGFNYTNLYSLTNMAKVTNHKFGTANSSNICVLGTSLNNETFNESYVPHINYEDDQILPYEIRLQHLIPPQYGIIKTRPEAPREDVETEILVDVRETDLVASGWMRYSIDGDEPTIIKMASDGEDMIGNLGLLEGGTVVSYEVCLQDHFLNTIWSTENSTLIASFEIFNIYWDEIEYRITAFSNSTLGNLNFSKSMKQISLNVTGLSGTLGFCNVTIPADLLWGEFSVYKDETPLVIGIDYTKTYNDTHNIFYITYSHSSHLIKIIGTEVIPELSSHLALVLLMIVTIVVFTFQRKK